MQPNTARPCDSISSNDFCVGFVQLVFVKPTALNEGKYFMSQPYAVQACNQKQSRTDPVITTDKLTEPVRVFRRGQLTEIVPALVGLCGEFQTVDHQAKMSKKGFEIVALRDPLIWEDTDSRGRHYLQTFAGMEPYLLQRLDKSGLQVELTGSRPKPLRKPRCIDPRPLLSVDFSLIDFVRNNERGLIRYNSEAVQPSWLVAQIAQAWPNRRIVVIGTRDNDVWAMFKYLRRYGVDVSVATTDHHPMRCGQVVVATASGIKQTGIHLKQRSVYIALNPTEVFNKPECLPHIPGRLYGLLIENLAIASRTMDLLKGLFGPSRLYIPWHGCHEVPVSVIRLPFRTAVKPAQQKKNKGSPDEETGFDLLGFKRQHIWNNPVRNRWIAGLAKAISQDDGPALTTKYPSMAKDLNRRVGQRVGVLVENVDHAAQLLSRLKGWKIIAPPDVVTQRLNQETQVAIRKGRSGAARLTGHAIVTSLSLASAGTFDVLIRADAGAGLPPIPRDALIARDGTQSDLVVIDIEERHHFIFRQRCRARVAAYRERGWLENSDGTFASSDNVHSTPRPDHQLVLRIPYLREKLSDVSQPHLGTNAWRKRCRRRSRISQFEKTHVTLSQVANNHFLYDCFLQLREHGGWGAGLDQITFSDLSPTEWGAVTRQLQTAILRSRYRPQAPRHVSIPKPGTTEKRTLKLGSIVDRVVALALHRTLEPHFDKLFLPGSSGFRHGLGTWHILADLKNKMEDKQQWIMAIEDVRKAFDNVEIAQLVNALTQARQELMTLGTNKATINHSVFNLIAAVAKGTTQERTMGIDQGNNFSPTSLNILLHYIHDVPLTATGLFPFWWRYADNLVYLCRDVSEGHQMLLDVQGLLGKAGLTLKGKDGVTDLRVKPVQLLGFQLQELNGKLQLCPGKQAWDELRRHLMNAHETTNPTRVAQQVILGWIGALGPAFENGERIAARICKQLLQFGFREISPALVEERVKQAWERWKKVI
jgi:retron-type reverse transcriptase